MKRKTKKKVFYYSYSTDNPHELYQELFRNPPEGYEYIFTDSPDSKRISVNRIVKLKKFKILEWLNKKILNRFISPYSIVQTLSRFRKIPEDTDIVHCASCLYFGNKPWIVDMESVNGLVGHNQFMLAKNKEIIERAFRSPLCKRIITFTAFAKKTIEENLDTRGFQDKLEVIHYSTKIYSKKAKRNDKKIRMLFVGSVTQNNSKNFYIKGGREVIDAFEILSKKYKNIELVLVAYIPPEIEKRIKKMKNVRVYNKIPREELSKIYYQSDIFFFPSFIGPGLASIEALGTGLVSVSLDIPEYDEFVEDGKNGYLIKPAYYEFDEKTFLKVSDFEDFSQRMRGKNGKKLIIDLKEKLEFLIKNPKIRREMAKHAVEKYKKEFSLDSKRKKMKKIFDEIIEEKLEGGT
jgi:glycosyltransferase involved in cell wall biosynthesis